MIEECTDPAEIQEGDLVAYIEGIASPQVASHIAACPACAAEVEVLRLTDSILQQALSQMDCLVDDPAPVCNPKIKMAGLSGGGHGRFRPLAGWGQDWRPLAVGLTFIMIILALPASLYLVRQQLPQATPEAVREQRTTAAVTVEEVTAEIMKDVAAKVTHHDRLDLEQDTVDALPSGPVIVEEMVEIVPPRSLRRMIEQEFQGQTDELAVYSPARLDPDGSPRQVISADDQAYAIWTAYQNGQTALYFVRSIDNGRTWSRNVQINRGIDRVYSPNMALDTENNNLYVVWRSGYHANATMYLARSIDNGQSWSKRVRVDGAIGRIFNPNLAVGESGNLYVTWQNREQSNFSIYFIRSRDGGQTWSEKMRVARLGG